MEKCTVVFCKSIIKAQGLCNMHYQRHRIHGHLEPTRIRPKCSVDDCNKDNHVHGFCPMHHRRWKIHGDPLFVNPKCNRDGKAKERHKKYQKIWRKENWHSYRAYLASRKKRVKKATPRWADLKAIKLFYVNCPKGFHVDHIVPITGRKVSGLHVMNNLQYLPAKDNMSKGNSFSDAPTT
jgi:hypothetical protein